MLQLVSTDKMTEEKALNTEKILSDRYLKLKEAQEKYIQWSGFRTDTGYATQLEKAKKELDEFVSNYTEYLI